jgi:hypothetical protein
MAKLKLPIDDGTRKYLDDAFSWIVKKFGLDELKERKTITPTEADIPIKFDKSEGSLYELLDIVCKQMEIDPETIRLTIFRDKSDDFGNMPLGRQDKKRAAGLYLGKDALGLSEIAFDIAQLDDLASLISIMSHELCHVHLLGENLLSEEDRNHEIYTEILSIHYGFGIFLAYAAWKNSSSGGMHHIGYLKLPQIGYLLALYSYRRQESNPEWIGFIPTTVKPYYDQSIKYLKNELANTIDALLKSNLKKSSKK